MTTYEFKRWLTYPLLPVILITVRKNLKYLLNKHRSSTEKFKLLDVGGRKSPYTIGLNADITLLDVPQENQTQEQLNLGFTNNILETVKKNRSNISDIVIQDMTKSTLTDASFDGVVSVEVIEHVEEDTLFVENIAKVVRKGGWVYFTTPNGDYIKNEGPDKNPDHKRHYTRKQLQQLLENYFSEVDVHYAVHTGKYRVWGLKSFNIKRPLLIVRSIFGNFINRVQSKNVKIQSQKTAHLIAIAYK